MYTPEQMSEWVEQDREFVLALLHASLDYDVDRLEQIFDFAQQETSLGRVLAAMTSFTTYLLEEAIPGDDERRHEFLRACLQLWEK